MFRSLKNSELDWMMIDIESKINLIGGRISTIGNIRLSAW
jgi:hypothetical protein